MLNGLKESAPKMGGFVSWSSATTTCGVNAPKASTVRREWRGCPSNEPAKNSRVREEIRWTDVSNRYGGVRVGDFTERDSGRLGCPSVGKEAQRFQVR